jgi:hypothetical protein
MLHLPQQEKSGALRVPRGDLPGAAHAVLVSNVVHLDPAPAVFDAMLEGWRRQQLSRMLSADTIDGRLGLIRRFMDFAGTYPWQWKPSDVEDWTTSLLSGDKPCAHSTIRSYQNALRLFMEFLTDRRYGWEEECTSRFGDHPVQICHEWNTVEHLSEFEGRPTVRPLTYEELESFFARCDERIQEIRARVERVCSQRFGMGSCSRRTTPGGCADTRMCGSTWPICAGIRTSQIGASSERSTFVTAKRSREVRRGAELCFRSRTLTGRWKGWSSTSQKSVPPSALGSTQPSGSMSGGDASLPRM